MKVSFAHIEKARITDGPLASTEGQRTGAFVMGRKIPEGISMVHMLSDHGATTGWERVTITEFMKPEGGNPEPVLPNLQTITDVKNMFWDKNESVVIYFHESIPDSNETPAIHLWKSKRQNYILPILEIIDAPLPDNVIPLPEPSSDKQTPPAGV